MQSRKQLLNTLLIIIGAGLLIYDLVTTGDVVWIKISGLMILMIGLYTATKNWVRTENTEEDEEGGQD